MGILQLKAGALIDANGGDGGIKGYPNSTVGTCFDNAAQGGGGSGGRIKIISTCNPLNEYNSTISNNGGIGFGNGNSGTYTLLNIFPSSVGPITGIDSICPGQSGLAFTIPVVSDAQGYSWSVPAGATITNGNNTTTITVSWGSATSGYVIAAAINGCGSGTPDSLYVTVITPPAVSITGYDSLYCTNDPPATLTGNPPGGSFFGAGMISGIFYPSGVSAGPHDIIYIYTDGNGCTGSDTITVIVDPCTGINYISGNSFNIYPNPNNGEFTILSGAKVKGCVKLSVMNALGEEVYKQIYSADNEYKLNLRQLSSGIYCLKLESEKITAYRKVIIN
jgi:hypothetical protein